ncbi:MAG: hypothetical protein EOO47_08905 [Flavobacterium sp.]|nr:MAG: hypothetical protein EOO47_08905 [Flavobacterium sp.]
MKQIFTFLLFIFFVSSCAGTHGSIESYQFDTSKAVLEQAVKLVLRNNTASLQEDKIKDASEVRYLTIFITFEGDRYGYRLHYYGDEAHWKSSKTSIISIASARINGIGGINSDVAMSDELKDKLLMVFEQRFIRLVNQALKENPRIN